MRTIVLLVAVAFCPSLWLPEVEGSISITHTKAAVFASRRKSYSFQAIVPRGGATTLDDEEDKEEEEGEIDEEELGEDAFAKSSSKGKKDVDAVLAAAAVKSTTKEKTKKASKIKKEVSMKLSTGTKKKRSGLLKGVHVPYIIRACLNPFTVIAMTKAYWASLFNLNYLSKDSSQELRSAVEEKARKGPTTMSKTKRKMKRGQAKTLSDLPQLST